MRTTARHDRIGRRASIVWAVLALVALFATGAGAETVKIGVVKGAVVGPVYLAQDKGYFAAEGLTVEIVYFDAAQPIAVAAASGDIDFGGVGLTGGLYSLGGQGALRIIAGFFREAPGFKLIGYLASNKAYAAGLTSLKELGGHSIAVTQIGSALHYALGLAADKYKIDLKTVRILPLQANANIASAITGGQADAALLNSFYSGPLVVRGEAKALGWVGDETPWQMGAVFTATRNTNERSDMVQRFLRAYRKGAEDFNAAFAGADGTRKDGPTADTVAALIAKQIGQSVDDVKATIPAVDPELRLEVRDILRQIDWYKAQGMVKGPVDGDVLIDKRYVIPLPQS
jgi:NitT/TauT family transport system substrate-binding protein